MTGQALFLKKEMMGQKLFRKTNDGAKNFSQSKIDRAETFHGIDMYKSHKIYSENTTLEFLVRNIR